MRFSIILLLLSLITTNLEAQSTTIDSLQKAIKKHEKVNNEVNRIEAILALGKAYVKEKDYKKAIEILEPEINAFSKQIPDTTKGKFIAKLAYISFQKAENQAEIEQSISLFEKSLPYMEKSKNLVLKANTYAKYGVVLLNNYEDKKAVEIYEKAIKYFEKNKTLNKQWISAIGNLSGAYGNIGNNDESLKYARQGKEMAKQMNNDYLVAMFALSTGESLLNIEQYDLAIENFEEAIKEGEKSENQFIIGLASYYIGSLKMDSKQSKDWENGKQKLEKAKVIFEEIQEEYYASLVNKAMAFYYENKKDYQQALAFNTDYIDYLVATEDMGGQGDGLIRQGRYYGKLEQFDSARFYLKKALDIHQQNQAKEPIERTYRNLSEVEEQAGNYQQALVYYKQFKTYRDSIFQEKVGETIGKESVTQDVEGAMSAKKEAEMEAEILSGQNRLYLAIAIGLGLILLIGGYLFRQLQKARKQLGTQNIQLTNLNETKDRFFGIIAHDIRGPITSLDGIGEQMAYYLKKNNPKRLNMLTTQIDKTAKKLTNLLDNLLNWALLQKGTIPYHPKSLNVHDIVQENLDLYAEVAEVKGISLVNEVEENTTAFADLSATTTVIRNLVNNAVKFTPKDGIISVNTTTENNKIFININDTGTGISANKLEKIFALNTERKKGTAGEKGSGLGLVLCKDLIELNKGTIKAISEIGRGSTFVISLPITNH